MRHCSYVALVVRPGPATTATHSAKTRPTLRAKKGSLPSTHSTQHPHLALGWQPDQPLALVRERHDGRRGARPLRVLNNTRRLWAGVGDVAAAGTPVGKQAWPP
jgi:hypothetical protein